MEIEAPVLSVEVAVPVFVVVRVFVPVLVLVPVVVYVPVFENERVNVEVGV